MKRILIAFLLISQAYIGHSQCFSLVWSGYGLDQMNIYVMGATINGANLQTGDRVGVFDGTYCVGIGTADGGGMLSITASKDDPVTVGVIDGYRTGNTMSFKICDISSGKEITDISVTLNGGSLVFEPSGSAFVTLTATASCTPPGKPVIGTVTQPTCSEATGSVQLTALPISGTWTINPGSISGSGISTVISGLNSGTYSWTITDAEGCTSLPTSTVTINPQPQAPAQPGTISGNATVCQGTSQTYSVNAVSGATSYNWTLPSGWNGTSTSNSISVTAGTEGGNISVTASNACGSSTARSLEVTVTTVPAQPSGILGDVAVCQGASETYSIDAVTGASSYTWSLPSGWTGTSSTSSITATPSATSGNISVTANNTCGSGTPRSLAVTVSTVPAQPASVSGNTSVCQGITLTYIASEVSGATSYSWTLPSGWTGSSTGSTIDVIIGNTSGNVTVAGVNACGTGTARSLAVTVSTIPAQPGSITGSASVCQGSSQTYSIPGVSGATSYTWTLPAGWTGSSTSNSITITAGTTGGDISVTASNACGTSTARNLAVTTTTVPVQPGTITGSVTPCQGSAQTYSVSAVTGATSYTWSLPSGWTGASTTNSITVTTGATSGNISVAANNSCGAGIARTLAVTVSPLPDQPASITGNASVCAGTSQTYSITAVTGASSYTWTLPAGWTGTSTSNSITATAGSGGTISVAANNACGAGTARTMSVTVSSVPAQPGSISGNASACQGSATTYSITAVTGATSYNWTLPAGWTGTSTTNSISATAGTAGGDISVSATNSCGTSPVRTLAVTTSTVPSQPGEISGNTGVCQGSSQTYSIGAVTGATSFTWTVPAGWTGTSTTNSITLTAGATNGNISVTANNSCGSGLAKSLAVTVTFAPAQPGSITGSASVCQGSSQTYSIGAVTGATSYSWSLPAGWTGTSTGTSITATAGSTGNVSVTANNTCGSGIARTLAVSVSAIPEQPGTISGNTTVCQGSSQSYSVSALSGATSYSWTLPSGWTGSSTSNSITVTAGSNGGTISVTASNSCGNSSTRSLTVSAGSIPTAPATGTLTQPTCELSTGSVALSGLPAAGTWTITANPGGISRTGSGTSYAFTGLNPGTYNFTVANTTGCQSAASQHVTLNSVPSAPTAPVIDAITQPSCGTSKGTIELSCLPASGTWTLTRNPGAITSTGTGTTTALEDLNPGTYSFVVSNASGCSSPSSANAVINAVTPTPSAPVIGTITQPSCSVSDGSVVLNRLPSGSWTLTRYPAGTITTGSGTSFTVEPLPVGTFTFAVTSGNSCASDKSSQVVINAVPSAPQAPEVGPITQPSCDNSTGSVLLNNLPSQGNWVLTRTPGTIAVSGSGTTETITNLAPGNYTFVVTNEAGCNSSASDPVNIDQQPVIPGLPVIDSVIQPTCALATGSIIIKNLPESWTLIMNPGAATITGENADTTISGLVPGDYSFILTGPSGCSTTEPVDTSVNDQPEPPSTPVISQTDEVLHSDAAAGNQWYDQNGLISNATAREYTVTATGDYYTIVTLGGCNSDPSNTIHVVKTGIDNSVLELSLTMYPNPVKTELMVEFRNYKRKVSYELINANGRIVSNGFIIERKSIETGALPSGVYLIKLETEGDYTIRKFIKE